MSKLHCGSHELDENLILYNKVENVLDVIFRTIFCPTCGVYGKMYASDCDFSRTEKMASARANCENCLETEICWWCCARDQLGMPIEWLFHWNEWARPKRWSKSDSKLVTQVLLVLGEPEKQHRFFYKLLKINGRTIFLQNLERVARKKNDTRTPGGRFVKFFK